MRGFTARGFRYRTSALPVALGLTLAALCGVPAAAAAATWFAAPDGDGGAPCTATDPCAISDAVTLSPSGSKVALGAGSYGISGVLQVGSGKLLQGPYSGPPATLTGDGPGLVMRASGAGTRVTDLNVVQNGFGSGLAVASGAMVDRIESVAAGSGAACMPQIGGILHNSLCRSTGSGNGVLMDQDSPGTGAAEIVNVTAVSSSDDWTAAALMLRAYFGADVDLLATNVIAYADGAAPDVLSVALAGWNGDIELASSNYDEAAALNPGTVTPAGTAGNQTGLPLFADAAGGDFSELAESPTVDAGAGSDSLGLLDLRRRARVVGTAPDIGALELQEVDTRPPNVSIPVAPPGRIKTRKRFVNVTFELASDEPNVTFECKLNPGQATACTSPVTFRLESTRGDGTLYTLVVRATDAAGNRSGKAIRQVRVIRKRR